MAQRRMISLKVIDTDHFLDMPISARYLYFELSMRADDDGFVSAPKRLQRYIGCSDDDFKILFQKTFIIPFDSGICVIKHWNVNNYIPKDRYTPTIYQLELSSLRKENRQYFLLKNDDKPCIQNVLQTVDTEQNRLEQISIEQQTNSCCSVDNFLVELENLNINQKTALSFIKKFGIEKVKFQLENLQNTKNIKNNGAWLNAALENDYQPAPIFHPVPDPNCPTCNGTGKVSYKVGTTNEIICYPCRCISTKN